MTTWIISKNWELGDKISGRIVHWQENSFHGKPRLTVYLTEVEVNGVPHAGEYAYVVTNKAEDWLFEELHRLKLNMADIIHWKLTLRKDDYEAKYYEDGGWRRQWVEAFVPIKLEQ